MTDDSYPGLIIS